jgi:hypothetical protein
MEHADWLQAVVPLVPPRPQAPDQQGDRIQPFVASGGTARWSPVAYVSGAPQVAGAQLLCFHHVPEGMVGFVKMITAAPFKPSILHNSQYTELVPSALDATTFSDGNSPDSDNGWWSTPFGWEGYASRFPLEPPPPEWRWNIQLIPGRIDEIRSGLNIPPFSFADPLSWYLVPNIPVPSVAYQMGLPGNAPSGWGSQRMQWTDWLGEVHLIVPSDTTVALFAQWTQEPYNPYYQATDGAGTVDLGRDVLVLGPSFGRMSGFTQAADRESARRNAVYGWAS